MAGKSWMPQSCRNKEKFPPTAEDGPWNGPTFCGKWSSPYEGEQHNLLFFPFPVTVWRSLAKGKGLDTHLWEQTGMSERITVLIRKTFPGAPWVLFEFSWGPRYFMRRCFSSPMTCYTSFLAVLLHFKANITFLSFSYFGECSGNLRTFMSHYSALELLHILVAWPVVKPFF